MLTPDSTCLVAPQLSEMNPIGWHCANVTMIAMVFGGWCDRIEAIGLRLDTVHSQEIEIDRYCSHIWKRYR
jgi:hypothetical protein